jgi:deoxyribonuclease-4
MRLLGAHVSIAGGVEKAPERGHELICNTIQIFTKSNVQWAAKPLTARQKADFLSNLDRFGIQMAFAHACYLINLCSADAAIRKRSWRGLATEVERCAFLELPYLVVHPGSHGGQGEQVAIEAIVQGTLWAMEKASRMKAGNLPMLLLETTAGQGNGVGWRLEQLAEILTRLNTLPVGICLDTCHIFAAGYDLRERDAYERTMADFDRCVGLDRIRVFHLNDSLGELGSRRDRHAHIGRGKIGLEGFRLLLNDPRFADRPMVIETPKGRTASLDVANLRRLRRLIAPSSATE